MRPGTELDSPFAERMGALSLVQFTDRPHSPVPRLPSASTRLLAGFAVAGLLCAVLCSSAAAQLPSAGDVGSVATGAAAIVTTPTAAVNDATAAVNDVAPAVPEIPPPGSDPEVPTDAAPTPSEIPATGSETTKVAKDAGADDAEPAPTVASAVDATTDAAAAVVEAPKAPTVSPPRAAAPGEPARPPLIKEPVARITSTAGRVTGRLQPGGQPPTEGDARPRGPASYSVVPQLPPVADPATRAIAPAVDPVVRQLQPVADSVGRALTPIVDPVSHPLAPLTDPVTRAVGAVARPATAAGGGLLAPLTPAIHLIGIPVDVGPGLPGAAVSPSPRPAALPGAEPAGPPSGPAPRLNPPPSLDPPIRSATPHSGDPRDVAAAGTGSVPDPSAESDRPGPSASPGRGVRPRAYAASLPGGLPTGSFGSHWRSGTHPAASRSGSLGRSVGLPAAPAAPAGASGGGSSAGGPPISMPAVLLALAGLAALSFQRLLLAAAAWRSVALVALLERPG
jgi:hypothetical protein